MARRETDPTSAIDLLNPAFGQLAHGFGSLLAAWRASVGPQIADHATPSSLRDGVLRVRCGSAAWATELQHLSPQILDRMTTHLPDTRLDRMRCYTASAATPSSLAPAGPGTRPAPAPPRALRDDESAAIASTVAPLADPGLRVSVMRAMAAMRRTR